MRPPKNDKPIPSVEEFDRDNERLRAVALRYEKADGTPTVIAKGQGHLAEEILERASEAGVFVHSSRELVALLMQVDLDARIPANLYTAVAEILAWVYEQDERLGHKRAETLNPQKKL